MRTHSERSKHRRSVQLEFLENRSLLSQLPVISPTAEVRTAEVRTITIPYRDSAAGTSEVVGRPILNDEGQVVGVNVIVQGIGEATYVGRSSGVGYQILTFDEPGNPTSGDIQGTFTTTTKDGATISGTYSGRFTTQEDGLRRNDLIVQFVQGTGRLDGVTGTAHTVVIVTPTSQTTFNFTYTSEGTLTLPDRPLM